MEVLVIIQRSDDQGGGSGDGEKQRNLRYNLNVEQRKFVDKL